MRHFISLAMCGLLAVGLAGCGGGEKPATMSSAANANKSVAAAAPVKNEPVESFANAEKQTAKDEKSDPSAAMSSPKKAKSSDKGSGDLEGVELPLSLAKDGAPTAESPMDGKDGMGKEVGDSAPPPAPIVLPSVSAPAPDARPVAPFVPATAPPRGDFAKSAPAVPTSPAVSARGVPTPPAVAGESKMGGVPETVKKSMEVAKALDDAKAKLPPGVSDAVAGTASRLKKPAEPVPPAGTLTAGSFDDNIDPKVFASFTNRFQPSRWQESLPTKLAGPRVQILVKDAGGKPVGGARVRLSAGSKGEEVVTRAFGQATFVLTWDEIPVETELTVEVTPPGGGKAVSDKIPAGAARWEVTLPTAQAKLPKNLDVAFVLDTTGSMGDELKYLIGEFKGIAADIKAKFPEVNTRFGLVLYRDFGDEYLTRPFEFTTSAEEFHRNLSKQSAGGGGDSPEAVHKGLEEAQQLRWRNDPDTARVIFLIGDAPPHVQHVTSTMKAINSFRKEGVAIYPVACSGYDDACELVWRSSALLTSSQFLFLTDDSGVGGAHAEPKIPYYEVEHLNKLMVRMVAGELTGERIRPAAGEVIRTVGRKVN